MTKSVRVLSAAAVLSGFAVACGTAGQGPIGAEQTGSGEQAATLSSVVLVPTCTTSYVADPCSCIAPSYVLRLEDTDGQSWWPYYPTTDNYTVAFPTPWVTNNASASKPYVYDPDVYAYERLIGLHPSHVGHEYLVYKITTTSCIDPSTGGSAQCIKGIENHQYFVVGFTSNNDLAQAQTNAQKYSSYLDVQSKVLQCVHIMDGSPTAGAVLTSTGENYVFAHEHDPSTNPW